MVYADFVRKTSLAGVDNTISNPVIFEDVRNGEFLTLINFGVVNDVPANGKIRLTFITKE